MRQYLVVQCFGRPDTVYARLRQSILRNDMARMLSVVKFEKGAQKEFYVAIAVDGPGGERLPREVHEVLVGAGMTGFSNYPIAPQNLASMFGNRELEIEGLDSLPYTYLPAIQAFDHTLGHAADFPGHSDSFDRMLAWMSANGTGSREALSSACLALGFDSTLSASRILRRLALLGHARAGRGGSQWSVLPPTLRRDRDGVMVLEGSRTNWSVGSLTERAGAVVDPQIGGPSRVSTRALQEPVPLSRDGTVSLSPVYELAEQMIVSLPELRTWVEGLETLDGLETAHLTLERWVGDCWQPISHLPPVPAAGFYQFTPLGHSFGVRHLLFDPGRQRWAMGDWYGLRFAGLILSGVPVRALWSPGDRLLFPTDARPPFDYERALVAQSGFLPQPAGDGLWLAYANVSRAAAKELCTRLGIELSDEQ